MGTLVQTVKIRVPHEAVDAFFFTGPNIAEHKREGDIWTIRFEGEQTGDYVLGVRGAIPVPADKDDSERFDFKKVKDEARSTLHGVRPARFERLGWLLVLAVLMAGWWAVHVGARRIRRRNQLEKPSATVACTSRRHLVSDQ